MLLPLDGRRLYCDLTGPETGPVVCFTHSLASDSGMWAEQLPPLLAAGYRVLRLDMRGHGGSDPVPGDYTMSMLAGDVAAAIEILGLDRVHFIGLSIAGMLGQAFIIEHAAKAKSAMLCDTLPATLPDAKTAWAPRTAAVKQANSLAGIADGTMDRWFKAVHARTGELLWTVNLGGTVASGPMTYASGGRQYVAVSADTALYVFALPE